MAKNVNVKGFRKSNHLTQGELGDFLKCSKGFISQVEAGLYPLPDDKLDALLNNDMGWDVSALLPESEPASVAGNMNALNNSNVQVSADPALVAVIQEQQAQMGRLIAVIENLTGHAK